MQYPLTKRVMPRQTGRTRIAGPAADLIRVFGILAGFIGLAIALGIPAGDAGVTGPAPNEDWHGNVARSRD